MTVDLAVILAGAGEGRRMGGSGPKLLLEVRGRTLLEHAASAFLACDDAGEIVAVVPAALLAEAEARLARFANPRGARLAAVAGGATRRESVALGLDALARGLPYTAVHDVARAFVPVPLIARVLAAARAAGAAIPALPVRDTLKEVVDGRIVRTLPRGNVQGAQTPQVFAHAILARAHAFARDRRLEATDDAALAEAIGAPVAVVPGDPANLKITEPTDLIVLQALLDAGPGGPRA
jgi:2-C-methyl-D-erythritol 4-phosphate cytidylyltransferase